MSKKRNGTLTGPLNQKFLKDFDSGKMSHEDVVRWKYQRYMKNYLGTVRAVDENVGRMLKYLDDHDLAKNTIVIYSSDQDFILVNMVGMTNAGCSKSHLKCRL